MEQKFEGTPHADVSLEGRKVTRTDVTNDWGLRLQWQVSRDGKVVGTAAARPDVTYEHADETPGKYDVVLQMWKYVNYRKNAQREYVDSKYVDVSNVVSYTIEKS
jgi:hypothetical protein